jgi:uncharacterized protein RhaS with RHS repeats
MGLYTQQDPIGIAGGLNLYGYANGDPVNYSDPYGLCPIWVDGIPCFVQKGLAGAAVGGVAGAAVGATGGSFAVPGVGTVAGGGGGAVVGAAVGLAAGTLVGGVEDLGHVAASMGDKVKRWTRALGLAGGLILPGPDITSTTDPTPVDPAPPIEAPTPRPTPTDTIPGGGTR